MTHRIEGFLLIGLMIVLSLVFQTQMKSLANELSPVFSRYDGRWASTAAAVLRAAMGWRTVVVFGLAALLFIVWLLVLTRVELSVAVPVASVAVIVTAVGGGIMLGEPQSWVRIAGIVVTAIGIGLVVAS